MCALKSILQFKRIITIIKLCSYLTSPNHEGMSGLFLQAKKGAGLWKVSSISKYENYITGEEVLAQTYILKIEALRTLIIESGYFSLEGLDEYNLRSLGFLVLSFLLDFFFPSGLRDSISSPLHQSCTDFPLKNCHYRLDFCVLGRCGPSIALSLSG